MKKQIPSILISSALALAITGSAQASTILLTDNFNEIALNDNVSTFNDNLASTQGGTLGVVNYSVSVLGVAWVAQHSNGGSMILANDASPTASGYGSVSSNNNFAVQANAAKQPLQVRFNIGNVFGYDADPTRWVQFNISNSQNLGGGNAGAGAGVLFRKNGESTALSGAAVHANSTWGADNLVTITLTDTAGFGSAFNGNGSKATVSIGANNLGTYALAQQTDAYLTFSAYNYSNGLYGGGSFDNLSVALIPEPSAALLGGLGMLALLRRRR